MPIDTESGSRELALRQPGNPAQGTGYERISIASPTSTAPPALPIAGTSNAHRHAHPGT